MRRKCAYTLVEVMTVVIIMGILAAVAIPNYRSTMQRAREKDMIRNLTMVREALFVYNSRYGTFPTADMSNVYEINDSLSTYVIPNDIDYYYTAVSPSDRNFLLNATWVNDPDGTDLVLSINEQPTDSSNPCCAVGPCHLATTACP